MGQLLRQNGDTKTKEVSLMYLLLFLFLTLFYLPAGVIWRLVKRYM